MSNVILCVDDSATMQTVAEITFHGSAWEYVGARNADEARSAASGRSPAIILVDAIMPDGSGYDLAKHLKASNAEAVVVMVCGNSEAYDESKGRAAGCDGHIAKPWQTDKLIERIGELANASAYAPVPAPSPAAPASVAIIRPIRAKAPIRTPPRVAAEPPARPVATTPTTKRASMIREQPGKRIRLVLASQAEAVAANTATASGLNAEQAAALNAVSRELLEQIIWDIVPLLAESIIRENLHALTARARQERP